VEKLSKAQIRTLEKLSYNEWKTAYEIKESLATLFALEQKGLIERKKGEMVWFGWERTGMSWRKKNE